MLRLVQVNEIFHDPQNGHGVPSGAEPAQLKDELFDD